MAGLFATESQWFDAQRRNARQQFEFGKAQNRYQASIAKAQHGWDKADLLRQYSDARKGLAGSYVQGGRFGGGMYHEGLTRLGLDKLRDLRRVSDAYGLQKTGFRQTYEQLAGARSTTLQNLTEQENALKKHLDAVAWAAAINQAKNG